MSELQVEKASHVVPTGEFYKQKVDDRSSCMYTDSVTASEVLRDSNIQIGGGESTRTGRLMGRVEMGDCCKVLPNLQGGAHLGVFGGRGCMHVL